MSRKVSRSIRVCGWLYLASIMTAAPGSAAEQSPPARTGIQVYQQVCIHCHETNVGPAITGRGLNLPVVKHFVRNGNNAMPAWRPTEISDTELERLAVWLEASPPPARDARKPPAGHP